MPRIRPISSSDFGSAVPLEPVAQRRGSPARARTARRPPCAAPARSARPRPARPASARRSRTRSPNDAESSSPTGLSSDATARAAARTSRTCFSGSFDRVRELLVGRRALELRDELALGARDPLLALDDVHRDADRARLVRDTALNRLADPPRRVRRELEPLAPVELLGRADQPDDPFLDQVEQRQAVTLVLLRDRDDEPQVRVDEQILRRLVAVLDPLRELDLLRGRQQRVAAGLVQEQLQRVGRRGRDLRVRVARPPPRSRVSSRR